LLFGVRRSIIKLARKHIYTKEEVKDMERGACVAEYISSFPTGFEDIVARHVPHMQVYNGLVHHRGEPGAPFFNNSWHVLRFFEGKNLAFHRMVSGEKMRYPISDGTFRVRFSKSNQFAKVDKQVILQAERAVMQSSRLKLDRLDPTTELWYVIRDEGFGFYGQLRQKRAATEKNLHPGELRPEFAYLMCLCGNPARDSVVLDPFAGYGAIPMQIMRHFQCEKLYASDNDPEKVRLLKKTLSAEVHCADALNLSHITDGSIDVIITDPPWGYYEGIENITVFYEDMLREFGRILRTGGRAVILSARKEEFTRAIERYCAFAIENTIHTLVNGKKAGVYVFVKTREGGIE